MAEAIFAIQESEDGNWTASASEADAFVSILTNFDFIINLVVVRMCLGYTKSATVQLQGAHIDIFKGLQCHYDENVITNCKEEYKWHISWYNDAIEIASKVGAAVHSPRICKRQTHRGNIPAEDVSPYFKRNLSIPFKDHLLQEPTTRFSANNCTPVALSIVPAVMMNNSLFPCIETDNSSSLSQTVLATESEKPIKKSTVNIHRLEKKWKKDLLRFFEQYFGDMPSIQNVSHEVDNLESFWLLFPKEKLPSSLTDTIKTTNPITFPNISIVLRILATLPITSCTCEKSASAIRLLKSYLKSTMSQTGLNGLASLYTHKDIEVLSRVL